MKQPFGQYLLITPSYHFTSHKPIMEGRLGDRGVNYHRLKKLTCAARSRCLLRNLECPGEDRGKSSILFNHCSKAFGQLRHLEIKTASQGG